MQIMLAPFEQAIPKPGAVAGLPPCDALDTFHPVHFPYVVYLIYSTVYLNAYYFAAVNPRKHYNIAKVKSVKYYKALQSITQYYTVVHNTIQLYTVPQSTK